MDPGFKGALGRINAAGTSWHVEDLPVLRAKGKSQEFNLPKLGEMFKRVASLPSHAVGIEWPTTRPGEGAERSERFGRGKGYLHAAAHFTGCDYYRFPPNLWKGRLGLPGKSDPDATKSGAALLERYYPGVAADIHGPRGGCLDGRVDALCIAHFLRVSSIAGLKSTVETFGKNSPEAWALCFRGGKSIKIT